MQHRREKSGADDRRIRFARAALEFVNLLHARRDLIFVKPRPHALHRVKLRIDGRIDRLAHQRQFARRFHLPHRADCWRDVEHIRRRHRVLQPLAPILQVRIAFLLLPGEQRVEIRVSLRQLFELRTQIGKRLHVRKSCFLADAGIVRAHLRPFPFFLGVIARRKIENLARALDLLARRRIGNQQHRAARLIVARQVIEILLLKEQSELREILVARIAKYDHRPIHLRSQLRLPRRILLVRLPEPRRGHTRAQQQRRRNQPADPPNPLGFLKFHSSSGVKRRAIAPPQAPVGPELQPDGPLSKAPLSPFD